MSGSLRSLPRRHWPPLLLALAALALAPLGPFEGLRYERGAVASGEWWRLLTAHLLHLNPRHLLLNLAGLALCWALVGERLSARAWALALPLLALLTGLALHLIHEIGWYVGLSGMLHGVLVLGAVAGVARGEGRDSWALLALVAAKLAWEAAFGPFDSGVGPVVAESHRDGAAAGLLLGLLALPALRRR